MPVTLDYSSVAEKLAEKLPPAPSQPESFDVWETEPAPLDVFLYDAFYLGLPPLSAIQTEIVAKMTDILPDQQRADLGIEGPRYEILTVLLGKGSGKDFMSRVSMARIAYLLLCLKNPQRLYDIIETDAIDMINMAYSASQASRIFFDPLVRLIKNRPYFKGRFEEHRTQLKFDKNIFINSGNSSQEAHEGYNPIIVVLDEIDAFRTQDDLRRYRGWNPEHSAEAIFKSLNSSVQSRFPGMGKTVLLSFLRRPDGFMMQNYLKAIKDPGAWAIKAATWEVNPTKKRSDFDRDFLRNPEDSAMRYACIPMATSQNYFRNRNRVYDIFHYDDTSDEPFPDAPINPFIDGKFLDDFRILAGDNSTRFMHVDIGVSNDTAAVACVHLAGSIPQFGTELPLVRVDFLASLDPHELGEIQIDDIRNIVREFKTRKIGKPLNIVCTFDQFQSRDSIQILNKEGILTGQQSVDRDDSAYAILKEVIYTRRLISPGNVLIVKELIGLIRIPPAKVDHPPGGSKDLADALAGAVKLLYESYFNMEANRTLVYEERVQIGDDYLLEGNNAFLLEQGL